MRRSLETPDSRREGWSAPVPLRVPLSPFRLAPVKHITCLDLPCGRLYNVFTTQPCAQLPMLVTLSPWRLQGGFAVLHWASRQWFRTRLTSGCPVCRIGPAHRRSVIEKSLSSAVQASSYISRRSLAANPAANKAPPSPPAAVCTCLPETSVCGCSPYRLSGPVVTPLSPNVFPFFTGTR